MSRKRTRGQQRAKPPVADPGPTLVLDEGSADASDSAPASSPRQSGSPISSLAPATLLIDDYRIAEVISSDTDCITYKAADVHLGMPVTIKEFAPAGHVVRTPEGALARNSKTDEAYLAARKRFLSEARVLVRFRHPSIMRAHRVFEANGTAYIVLDFETPRTLEAWLADLHRPPTQAEIDRLLTPLLSALASVHSQKLVHADLSPANILVRDSGSPVLINFGMARDPAAQPANLPSNCTNTRFAPPEIKAGGQTGLGPWSDLYALASIIVGALTGNLAGERELAPDTAKIAGASGYRPEFLAALDRARVPETSGRPQSVEAWTGIEPPAAAAPTLLGDTVLQAASLAPTTKPGVRDPQPATKKSPPTGAPLSQLFTRVAAVVPELEEETDIPRHGFESWLLPAAAITGFAGALLFATGMNFALAAVSEVAAAASLFLLGYLPLNRFLAHTTSRPDAIERRAEQATRAGAWMIAAVLALLAINPLFVGRFLPTSGDAPVEYLSVIIGVPAVLMGLFGLIGTPLHRSVKSFSFGAVNVGVLLISLLLFIGLTYVTLGTPAPHPAAQVNRYLYVVALLGTTALGFMIMLARLVARQRIKQARAML